jgi:hypothetical protein
VYDVLLTHVRRLKTIAPGWNGLERVLSTLSSIAHAESDGLALTVAQQRWLGMAAEFVPHKTAQHARSPVGRASPHRD